MVWCLRQRVLGWGGSRYAENVLARLYEQCCGVDRAPMPSTGGSKKSEKVVGTDCDDLIADALGKDKLIGGDSADHFYFAGEEPFKKKTVDKIIDFDTSEGDAVVIAEEAAGDLQGDPSLGIADTKNDLKQLSKEGHDLLYFEPKGDLYVNGNGDS